jgi:hypothetical protein
LCPDVTTWVRVKKGRKTKQNIDPVFNSSAVLFNWGRKVTIRGKSSNSESKTMKTNHGENGVGQKERKGRGWMKVVHNQKRVERAK